jgi:hypothetical protein
LAWGKVVRTLSSFGSRAIAPLLGQVRFSYVPHLVECINAETSSSITDLASYKQQARSTALRCSSLNLPDEEYTQLIAASVEVACFRHVTSCYFYEALPVAVGGQASS